MTVFRGSNMRVKHRITLPRLINTCMPTPTHKTRNVAHISRSNNNSINSAIMRRRIDSSKGIWAGKNRTPKATRNNSNIMTKTRTLITLLA